MAMTARGRKYSEQEKKEITQKLIEGYKKMAALNLELAEEGLPTRDETEK